jgi:hypothetical protein
VANSLGNSLSLVDPRTMTVARTLELGPASAADPTIYGQFLFRSAQLGRDGRFRGGVGETAPFRWTGHDAALDRFVQEEVTGLLQG